ncbi:MAG: glycosyltransferase family 4 protein, partial [Candidatus Binataceae bacterium]
MKIIFSTPDWIISGVNSFTHNLIRELRSAGHQPELLVIQQPNTKLAGLHPPSDIPVEFLRFDASRNFWESRWNALIEYLNHRAPCVYFPGYDFQNSCVAPCLNEDVMIIGVMHSDDAYHYDHLIRMGRYWNAVIAVSSLLRRKVAEVEPAIADRAWLIPYGVPHPAACPSAPPPGSSLRIIYCGRFSEPQKRISDLPKIADALERRGIPANWTLIGEGPQERELKQAFAPLLAAGKAQFPGALGNDAVMEQYGHHDCFVLTSNYEGLPLALLEAMAHGVIPVVSAAQSGIPDVLRDGVNGFA